MSKYYTLSGAMREYCLAILKRQGRRLDRCEQCGASTGGRLELHHTRYEGSTLADLQIVCMRCNRLGVNRGLA